MLDVRRIAVIFVIAVLFSILVNVSIEAVYPQPEYNNFCAEEPRYFPGKAPSPECVEFNAPINLTRTCKGYIEYEYDSQGCAVDAKCNSCSLGYDSAREKYNLVVFIISSLSGLVALVVGLYLPKKRNEINEWVGTGFLLGGLFAIAVGTVRYFGDMGRYMRPFVILVELSLVIYLAYKKLGKK